MSESDLFRTKQQHERNRVQGRIPADRLGYSLSQIAEVTWSNVLISSLEHFFFANDISYQKAERRASESKMEYEQVSKLVKSEVARFEQERIEDFKDSLHAFLEGMISRQKEVRVGLAAFYICTCYFFLIYIIIIVDHGLGELPTDAFEESRWRSGYRCANVESLLETPLRFQHD